MYARQELWKYRRQFDSCKYDWSIVSFKKLDITYVEQKVLVDVDSGHQCTVCVCVCVCVCVHDTDNALQATIFSSCV